MDALEKKWLQEIDNACNTTGFIWGKNDCCSWVNNIIKITIGRDFLKENNLKFTSKKQAIEQIKTFAGGDLKEAAYKIADTSKWREIEVLSAYTGCVALINSREQWTFAINRNGLWVCRSRESIAVIPLDLAASAWVVGNG